MMTRATPTIALAAALAGIAVPVEAVADDGELEGSELDFEADGPAEGEDEDKGGDENPLMLDTAERRDAGDGAEAAAAAYPREPVLRPNVLPAGLLETSFDAHAGVRQLVGTGNRAGTEAFRASGTLSVAAGITEELELGIHYGAGSLGEEGAVPGRAAAIEARYKLWDGIAAQVAVPLHFDPFAAGLTLGAPVKFTLDDRFAIVAGHDLVSFRLHRFQPHVADASENDELAALSETNTVLPRGEFALRGALYYQQSPELAVGGEIASRAVDFDTRDAMLPVFGVLHYAATNSVDIGARAGLFDLGTPTSNFGGSAFVAIRM